MRAVHFVPVFLIFFLQLQHNCCKSGTHIVVLAHVLQKGTTEAALSDMYMLQTAKGYMLWTIC